MAVKQLGKKSIFLTFTSIVIIAAVIVIFTPSDINLKKDISIIKTRVSKVDEYVFDLEKVYLENTLNANGRRTIIALIKYMDTQGFLTDLDFQTAFSEVLLDGTINDVDIDTYYPETIMTGKTYRDYLYANDDISITKAAEKALNVQTEFNPIIATDIRVSQISPWFVDVEADISFTVSTVEGIASWTRDVTIKTSIAIENFDDPYYLVKTDGSYINVIKRSATKFDEWDVEKVKDSIREGDYTHFENSRAPSFIDRFTDSIAPSSCCGIESLVNPNKLSDLGLPRNVDVSYVDYIFWSTAPSCPSSNLYTITGISRGPDEFSNFKLEFNHIVLYNLLPESQLKCPPEE